jgi:hypothetical protein
MNPQVSPVRPAEALVTVQILHPDGPVPVSNPIAADGTYSPTTATVTAWIIDGSGNKIDGTVTQNARLIWTATFGNAQAGSGSVNAKAQLGPDSATDSVPITIQ